MKNNILQSIFLSLFSILPVFTPTKHILNDIGESLITIATSLIIITNIILGIQQKMREFRIVQLCQCKEIRKNVLTQYVNGVGSYVTWIEENFSIIKSVLTHDVLHFSSS